MLVAKMMDYSRCLYTLLGDRRKTERVDLKFTVAMTCKHRAGNVTTHVCSCVNVSEHGIGLESLEPIPVSCDVYIHSETQNLKRFGRILWTAQRGDRFLAGCNLRPKARVRLSRFALRLIRTSPLRQISFRIPTFARRGGADLPRTT